MKTARVFKIALGIAMFMSKNKTGANVIPTTFVANSLFWQLKGLVQHKNNLAYAEKDRNF